jgi:hypothetical protein
VPNENADATAFDHNGFSICAQTQSGPEFFALVESIRWG